MDCQLREQVDKREKVLIIKGSTSDRTYHNFFDTIQAFGLKLNEPITVTMVLKTGDCFNYDYIKITK